MFFVTYPKYPDPVKVNAGVGTDLVEGTVVADLPTAGQKQIFSDGELLFRAE